MKARRFLIPESENPNIIRNNGTEIAINEQGGVLLNPGPQQSTIIDPMKHLLDDSKMQSIAIGSQDAFSAVPFVVENQTNNEFIISTVNKRGISSDIAKIPRKTSEGSAVFWDQLGGKNKLKPVLFANSKFTVRRADGTGNVATFISPQVDRNNSLFHIAIKDKIVCAMGDTQCEENKRNYNIDVFETGIITAN